MDQSTMLRSVMVVGAGVAGMRASIDLADSGYKVYLVDSSPSVGGVVAQLGFMFPTHDCILCRGTSEHGYGCSRPGISPYFLDHSQHPNIDIMTNTTVVDATGEPGNLAVHLHHHPRYVDPKLCVNCDECSRVCPVELTSEYQACLAKRKAAYKTAVRAAPNAYVIERGPYCDQCHKCEQVCPTKAIDLDQQDSFEDVAVGAMILAAGYRLYDPTPAEELGFGRFPNVLAGLQFERLASRSGPTEGVVGRPSDGKIPERIAWLQCVGSRDQEHPYCSSICCMYATKQAVLARQRVPTAACEIFIMDQRAFNKEYNAYYEQSKAEWGVQYTRCRISEIKQDPKTHDLILYYEDDAGKLRRKSFDMVVLSVGSEPPSQAAKLAQDLKVDLNEYGFCRTDKFTPLDTSRAGIFAAGAFVSPKEISETVMDGAGAAARCMATLAGSSGAVLPQPAFPPERDVTGEPPRVGIFACTCHPTIDSVIDVADVLARSSKLPGLLHTQALPYGCLPEGLQAIREAIREHNLNRVVIGACTPRTHLALFQRTAQQAGLNPHLVEFVSLRDECAWVHADNPVGATRQAREAIRVGVARARRLQPFGKETRPVSQSALVIGGGLAGMTAALAIAGQGFPVHLVEKTHRLGGNVRDMHSTAEGPDPQQRMQWLGDRVQEHERISVHYNTEVGSFAGRLGGFRSQLVTRANGNPPGFLDIEHGVTIVATGGREYRGNVLSYGQNPRVVTQMELDGRLANDRDNARKLRQVLMMLCVDPPDQKIHYCSRTCCTQAMKNALTIKQINPDCQVVVLFKELMTYGFREAFYTEARKQGVLFVRYTDDRPPQVEASQGQVEVRVQDLSLDQTLTFRPDLLVLSMPIQPAESNATLAHLLDVPLSPEGFFQENNLKLRPMDLTREGIFLAGLAHYPKFIEESISQAQAAAARANTILSKEYLEVGGAISVVDQAKCVGCLTCVRVCPFQVPKVDPQSIGVGRIVGAAYIDPAICTGCGICTSECPANAIQLHNYRDDELVLAEEPILGQWLAA